MLAADPGGRGAGAAIDHGGRSTFTARRRAFLAELLRVNHVWPKARHLRSFQKAPGRVICYILLPQMSAPPRAAAPRLYPPFFRLKCYEDAAEEVRAWLLLSERAGAFLLRGSHRFGKAKQAAAPCCFLKPGLAHATGCPPCAFLAHQMAQLAHTSLQKEALK